MGRGAVTFLTLSIGLAIAVSAGAVAAADTEPPPKCFVVSADGDLPTCTYVDGAWSVSYESEPGGPDAGGGGGIPGEFVALGALAAVAGAGVFVWRISLARRMARQAGMDSNRATAVTLLDDSGLGATYVASSLRPGQPTQPTTAPSVRSASERLSELEGLKLHGLVTDEEYQSRRRAIIDSL